MIDNGRIDIQVPNTTELFKMYDKIENKKITSFRDALTGNWENNQLSNTFFCKNNIIFLNNAIRQGVINKSGGLYSIGEQDVDQLKIIMRSVYL